MSWCFYNKYTLQPTCVIECNSILVIWSNLAPSVKCNEDDNEERPHIFILHAVNHEEKALQFPKNFRYIPRSYRMKDEKQVKTFLWDRELIANIVKNEKNGLKVLLIVNIRTNDIK